MQLLAGLSKIIKFAEELYFVLDEQAIGLSHDCSDIWWYVTVETSGERSLRGPGCQISSESNNTVVSRMLRWSKHNRTETVKAAGSNLLFV